MLEDKPEESTRNIKQWGASGLGVFQCQCFANHLVVILLTGLEKVNDIKQQLMSGRRELMFD